jgi:hypothetical protein
MFEYVRKWSPAVPGLLAKSGKDPLYASWVGLWTKIRDGEADGVLMSRQYREEVVALCRKTGFSLPPEESDAIVTAPAELRADTTCRLMFKLQKHLTDNVRSVVRKCEAEAEALGPEPSQSLADLWRFTGESDKNALSACVARADRILSDTERLDKWLNACGDSQIPLPSIKMVPSALVPRLLQAVREQREAVGLQMEMIPSRVKARRQKPVAELTQVLDRIDLFYEKSVDGQQASEAAVWQGAESRKALRDLFNEIRTAVKIVGK